MKYVRKTYALDSYAIITYLYDQPGAQAVEQLFLDAKTSRAQLLLSSINLGEIYYILLREMGKVHAEAPMIIIQNLPIDFIDIDRVGIFEAAEIKARGKLSYADSFCAALAKSKNAILVTGDPEFKLLEKEISIKWV